MECTSVGQVHFYAAQSRSHADIQLDHRARRVLFSLLGIVVASAALDLADPRQRAFDRVRMGGVDGQVEAYPGFAVAFEALDVAGAEGGGLGPGVEFGRDFQVDA
ncbi:hypothetical protein D3C71_1599840 [compost metagenome]